MPIGFKDLRTVAQLLAGASLPAGLKFKFKPPFPKKLGGFLNKIKKAASLAQTAATIGTPAGIATFALKGAAKHLAAQASKKLQNAVKGKAGKIVGNVAKVAALAGVGVTIIKQTNPNKLRLPQRNGPSMNPAAQKKGLAQTAAKALLQGALPPVTLPSAVLSVVKLYKTLDSLKKSPRFFDLTKAKIERGEGPLPPSAGLVTVSTDSSALYPQLGLLEDEIMYRLVLLAENVYQPTQEYAISSGFGELRILEGFRNQNSGKSPHERGEAFDFTLGDGSLEQGTQLYQLARWMRDNIIYDQIILCFSFVGGGQSWIHASFSPDARRRQVLTKTANDLFLPGLHLHGNYQNAALRGEHEQEAQTNTRLAEDFSTQLTERNQKLNPIDVDTPTAQLSLNPSGGAAARCLVDPFGKTYVPDNSKRGEILGIVAELLGIPDYLAMARHPDRTYMVPFAREVARRAGVGMNAVRGNANDPSGDAIAILNPTGSKGFGSWDTDKRVQIMDIVDGAHGPNPKPGWGDATDMCDQGGGYINPN